MARDPLPNPADDSGVDKYAQNVSARICVALAYAIQLAGKPSDKIKAYFEEHRRVARDCFYPYFPLEATNGEIVEYFARRNHAIGDCFEQLKKFRNAGTKYVPRSFHEAATIFLLCIDPGSVSIDESEKAVELQWRVGQEATQKPLRTREDSGASTEVADRIVTTYYTAEGTAKERLAIVEPMVKISQYKDFNTVKATSKVRAKDVKKSS